jgi:hypothetical protein
MYLASRFVWLCLYESLLTYVAHMDIVGDPLQGTCHARASEILITKMRKILLEETLGPIPMLVSSVDSR